jgi:hypothetical protein
MALGLGRHHSITLLKHDPSEKPITPDQSGAGFLRIMFRNVVIDIGGRKAQDR